MTTNTKCVTLAEPPNMLNSEQRATLCVDLDGTLVKGDVLYESALLLLKQNPLFLFLMPFWLCRGKGYLKQQISRRVAVDVSLLPYNEEFLAFLREEHRVGGKIILATSADGVIAERVSRHLGLFSQVIASDGSSNLTGAGKARRLRAMFGDGGFDYAGNAAADLAVWRHSGRAIVVNASPGVAAKAKAACPVRAMFPRATHRLPSVARAVRCHQWAKNVLIFVPLITSHSLGTVALGFGALLAFVAFSLCASSVYVLNDLLDIEADRHHPQKRRRPFAAADLSIPAGLGLMACLLAAAALVSLFLPRSFGLILLFYYALTLAYSLYFKKKLLLDVFFLAGLYTIRILAGAAATGIPCSAWLLAFSMFVFFSLALVKRFSELRELQEANLTISKGRSYRAGDVAAISSLGTASGLMSVLVLALYINSPQVQPLYPTPAGLWLLCPLFMYWISRIWIIADRGKMRCDPVLFALKDKVSYVVGLCVLVLMVIASSSWTLTF